MAILGLSAVSHPALFRAVRGQIVKFKDISLSIKRAVPQGF